MVEYKSLIKLMFNIMSVRQGLKGRRVYDIASPGYLLVALFEKRDQLITFIRVEMRREIRVHAETRASPCDGRDAANVKGRRALNVAVIR